jgi:hypothetical protein
MKEIESFSGIAERESVVRCTQCPHFNPDEAPCEHLSSKKPCPQKEEGESWRAVR